MTEDDRKRLAVAAASQAATGLRELLRFATEGPEISDRAFDEEVVELLLDAVKMTIEIEGDFEGERGQAYGAICKFLEGWT